jgi:hypothetical protein
MKTNLDKAFKNNDGLEKDGIWMEISEGVGFLVGRFGGFNSPKIKTALAKHYKPYARQVENGTLSSEKEREISTKVFVESCVIGWKGIEIDGKIAEFSKEAAIQLLTSLPELNDALVQYATDTKNYREDLGNF